MRLLKGLKDLDLDLQRLQNGLHQLPVSGCRLQRPSLHAENVDSVEGTVSARRMEQRTNAV